jgi:hypothetical protein
MPLMPQTGHVLVGWVSRPNSTRGRDARSRRRRGGQQVSVGISWGRSATFVDTRPSLPPGKRRVGQQECTLHLLFRDAPSTPLIPVAASSQTNRYSRRSPDVCPYPAVLRVARLRVAAELVAERCQLVGLDGLAPRLDVDVKDTRGILAEKYSLANVSPLHQAPQRHKTPCFFCEKASSVQR